MPGDVGILGRADMAMAGRRAVSLGTIRPPFPQMIATSVDGLLALIAAPDVAPGSCALQAERVLRGTLRPL